MNQYLMWISKLKLSGLKVHGKRKIVNTKTIMNNWEKWKINQRNDWRNDIVQLKIDN